MHNAIPKDLFYSRNHEWLRIQEKEATLGITAFAAAELGDIAFIDVTYLGQYVAAGVVFGTIEAVKTVSDLFMPISGVIILVNAKINAVPQLVNNDPYGEGWLMRFAFENPIEISGLLDAGAYQQLTGQV